MYIGRYFPIFSSIVLTFNLFFITLIICFDTINKWNKIRRFGTNTAILFGVIPNSNSLNPIAERASKSSKIVIRDRRNNKKIWILPLPTLIDSPKEKKLIPLQQLK